MGTLLYLDDGEELSDHEGWLDGWSTNKDRFTPVCSCGWHGDSLPGWKPGEDSGDELYDAAMEQWYVEHADPIRRERTLLEPILEAHRAIANDQAALIKTVRRAREGGASWTEIGWQLGISKQAAWERFGKDQPS
jgi:hypothetical protein